MSYPHGDAACCRGDGTFFPMYIINIKRAPGTGHDEAIEVETINDAHLYLNDVLPEKLNSEYAFSYDDDLLIGYCNGQRVLEAEIIPSWRVSKATGIRYATS